MKVRHGILMAGLLGPALAYAGGGPQQTRQQPGAEQAQQAGQAPRSHAEGEEAGEGSPGRIGGIVQDVDLRHGILRLQAGLAGGGAQGGTLTLRGTPGQLQNFKRGEYTTVSFAQYGPNRWVSLAPGTPERGDLRQAATVVGVVEDVDHAGGAVTLSQEGQRISLLAHPATLAPLEPGQRVTLSCQDEGGDTWVQQVQVSQGASQP